MNSPTNPSFLLGALILGAGYSVRMGRPKLLLPWGEDSVLGHLLEQWRALDARQIVVVHASGDEAILSELDRCAVPVENRVQNVEPKLGMFSSIVCAAQWTGWQPSLTHWAIVLGDQPHLRAHTLEQLLVFAAEHPQQVCQPAHNGKRRHPVVLPQAVFAKLAQSSAADLREFLLGHEVLGCESDDPGLELDIDRPQDYERALVLARLSREL